MKKTEEEFAPIGKYVKETPEQRVKAYELWALHGESLTNIAKILDKSRTTIHKWKKEDKWEEALSYLYEDMKTVLTPEELRKFVPDMKVLLGVLGKMFKDVSDFWSKKPDTLCESIDDSIKVLSLVSKEYQRLNVWPAEMIRIFTENKTSVDINQTFNLTGENLEKAYEIVRRIDEITKKQGEIPPGNM